MKANINFRGDLAKLSDQELADQLKANWEAYEATGVRPPRWYSINVPLYYSFRTPIRHRRAYRFMFALVDAGNVWLSLLFTTLLSSARWERFLRRDPVTDAHLSLCEIRDIMDEIERRVRQQRKR